MAVLVGSARMDENGKYAGGVAGDQTGKEVSTQAFYVHSKGWYIIRPKSIDYANAIASKMQQACDNPNIGYDQNQRLGVVTHGIGTTTPTECDCSSLVRECVKEATGTDPGNFTTGTEASYLAKTGLFEDRVAYTSSIPVYNGDILVTKTKGHTVIVVSGSPRTALKSNEEIAKEVLAGKWGNGADRKARLTAAGYDYSAIQTIINSSTASASSASYYPRYTGTSSSIVEALTAVGVSGVYSNRAKIAVANSISNYRGTSAQNAQMLSLLKQGKLIQA